MTDFLSHPNVLFRLSEAEAQCHARIARRAWSWDEPLVRWLEFALLLTTVIAIWAWLARGRDWMFCAISSLFLLWTFLLTLVPLETADEPLVGMEKESSIELTPDGVRYREGGYESLTPWGEICGVRLTRDAVYFMRGGRRILIIPRRAFGSKEKMEAFLRQARMRRP